ncbi:MAG: hypothetical protein AAB596_01245 [Patescibacteria group bacterium]
MTNILLLGILIISFVIFLILIILRKFPKAKNYFEDFALAVSIITIFSFAFTIYSFYEQINYQANIIRKEEEMKKQNQILYLENAREELLNNLDLSLRFLNIENQISLKTGYNVPLEKFQYQNLRELLSFYQNKFVRNDILKYINFANSVNDLIDLMRLPIEPTSQKALEARVNQVNTLSEFASTTKMKSDELLNNLSTNIVL